MGPDQAATDYGSFKAKFQGTDGKAAAGAGRLCSGGGVMGAKERNQAAREIAKHNPEAVADALAATVPHGWGVSRGRRASRKLNLRRHPGRGRTHCGGLPY